MKKKGFLAGLLMMACCIVPLLALAAFLPQIKSTASASGFNWSWLIMLACPLMHILMMKGMMGHGESCHGKENKKEQIKDRVEPAGEQTR